MQKMRGGREEKGQGLQAEENLRDFQPDRQRGLSAPFLFCFSPGVRFIYAAF
jgi:hypothetical protein